MLRYVNYDIVFQEIPNEVTLAINISNCPNRCQGCHSPYLMKNIGKTLNKKTLSELLERYCETATCICFMGGDAKPDEVERLAEFLQKKTNGKIKTGWYSGKDNLPQNCSLQNFNYIKLGAYKQHLGGLSVPTTNQRFYRIEHGNMLDQTYLFWQKAAVI